MKKFLLMMLGVLMALPALAQSFEYTYEGQTLLYEVNGDDPTTVNASKVNSILSGNLIIPSEVEFEGNGYTVTTIGEYAFSGCNGLTSIIIPTSVTSIGEMAFSGCSGLTSVIIANPNTNYSQTAFSGCSSLASILSDNGETLMQMLPQDSGDYVISSGVKTIKSDAFSMVGYIKSLTIPASLERIDPGTFPNNIEKVIFEDWDAWYNNISLGDIDANPYRGGAEIYAGDIRISACPALKEGMTEIKDYVNIGLEPYTDEVDLPTTLKRVGAYAFYNNKELYHVFLNDALEEIGEHAFDGCVLLENQTFPATLRSIGDYAYQTCTSLTEVELPEGLTELGKGVFRDCLKIEKAVLVADIDTLDDDLLFNCKALNKLYLPLNLKHIGVTAFGACTSLDQITLPPTLESIGVCAFGNGSLTKVVIPNSVTSLGSRAFADQSIKDLTIGSGLETIPSGAFSGNKLVSVKFSEGLKKIEEGAFQSNSGTIRSVILPSTLTELEAGAFQGTNILELVIPDRVTSLPSASCGSPSILTIGKNIKNIDANAFDFYNLLTFRLKANMPPTLSGAFPLTDEQNDQLTLVVNQDRKKYYETNVRWKQIDNIIEEGSSDVTVYLDGTYSLAEEIRMQSGLMPSRVTKLKVVGPLSDIDLRAIKENMVSLTNLDLSEVENVTDLPSRQFQNSLLTEIVLPNNLKTIGEYAFNNCKLLQMSELPESLESISWYAFADCPGVTFSRMPESVDYVGDGAFQNCTGISEMTVGSKFGGMVAGQKAISEYMFAGCSMLEKIDLSASPIVFIEENAFADCYELDEIILPETVEMIGGGAFANTAIRDLSFLPKGITTIDSHYVSDYQSGKKGAFSNCRRLVAATLPESLQSIPERLFEDCPRLLAVSMPSGVESVDANIVSGDKKLSNISCAAVEAPDAATGAFDNIRLRYVSLTVPTLSFRSYLAAPQWGKFETILNRIRIPVEIDKGVEVTNVAESEYQDMLKEDRLEEQQLLAQEEQEKEEEQAQILRRRAVRRAEARTAIGRSFAALFDGAQIQTGSEGSGTRIFINPEEGVKVTSIMFAGKEMIDQLEGNSILLPANTSGSLVIRTDAPVVEPGTLTVTLSDDALALSEGDSRTLTANIVKDGEVEVESQVWTSSDETVATVEDGVVTALKAGTATITLTVTDNHSETYTATCEVAVAKKVITVETIELQATEETIKIGEQTSVRATILPADADDKSIEWTVSDSSVLRIQDSDNSVCVLVGEKAGTATVTATAKNGATATVTIKVEAEEPPVIEPGTLTVTLSDDALALTEGDSETLTANIVKDGEVEVESEVWTSSDETVATVEDGVVTALKAGTATITLTVTDNHGETYTATCEVTVTEYVGVNGINVDDPETELYDLNGIRVKSVDNLVPGIYIIRKGGAVKKIAVK